MQIPGELCESHTVLVSRVRKSPDPNFGNPCNNFGIPSSMLPMARERLVVELLTRLHRYVRDSGAAAPIDEFLHRIAVDQQVDRLAHLGVRERRVLALCVRALALDFGPRVGGVQDDELLMAIPPDYLPKVIDGLKALSKNGLRYPIPPYGVNNDVRAGMGVSY